MNEKRLLMTVLALFILTVLNVNIAGVSATPASPYIASDPSNQRTQMAGLTFNVSITTDYSGSDVYAWHVQLTYNATVLQCTQVVNGDLINEDDDPTNAMFSYVIENNIGEVSAGAYFYYEYPNAPTTSSGPGTLVNITFTGTTIGNSSLTLGKETKLQGFNSVPPPGHVYIITEADLHPDRIGHGAIMITIPGDANGDKRVNSLDIGTLNAHWAPASGTPPWSLGYDRETDCNNDGYINSLDIGVVNAHWGQSW